jgi:hypothetical protein
VSLNNKADGKREIKEVRPDYSDGQARGREKILRRERQREFIFYYKPVKLNKPLEELRVGHFGLTVAASAMLLRMSVNIIYCNGYLYLDF